MKLLEVTQLDLGCACQKEDKEVVIIPNVTLCSNVSKNGRVYTDECLKNAVMLYEQCPVYVDHKEYVDSRSIYEKIGWIQNVQYVDGKLKGDLYLHPYHEFTKLVVWASKHKPDWCTLSHHVEGEVEEISVGNDKVLKVNKILKVYSVDIVDDGATVKNLFESYKRNQPTVRNSNSSKLRGHKMSISLREAVEKVIRNPNVNINKVVRLKKLLKILESSHLDAMNIPSSVGDEEVSFDSVFKDAVLSLVQKVFDGKLDAKDAIAKIKLLLVNHGSLKEVMKDEKKSVEEYESEDEKLKEEEEKDEEMKGEEEEEKEEEVKNEETEEMEDEEIEDEDVEDEEIKEEKEEGKKKGVVEKKKKYKVKESNIKKYLDIHKTNTKEIWEACTELGYIPNLEEIQILTSMPVDKAKKLVRILALKETRIPKSINSKQMTVKTPLEEAAEKMEEIIKDIRSRKGMITN